MKEKLITTLTIISILLPTLSLTGCGTTYQEVTNQSESDDYGRGYFTVITEWGGGGGSVYTIVYANDTKVKYLIVESGNQYGITPLYNTDGTLQIYDETEENKKSKGE